MAIATAVIGPFCFHVEGLAKMSPGRSFRSPSSPPHRGYAIVDSANAIGINRVTEITTADQRLSGSHRPVTPQQKDFCGSWPAMTQWHLLSKCS